MQSIISHTLVKSIVAVYGLNDHVVRCDTDRSALVELKTRRDPGNQKVFYAIGYIATLLTFQGYLWYALFVFFGDLYIDSIESNIKIALHIFRASLSQKLVIDFVR